MHVSGLGLLVQVPVAEKAVGREEFIPTDVYGQCIQLGGSWSLQCVENTIYSICTPIDRMLFKYIFQKEMAPSNMWHDQKPFPKPSLILHNIFKQPKLCNRSSPIYEGMQNCRKISGAFEAQP